MLHQVIGPFSQAQMRLLSRLRVLGTLLAPLIMLMEAMEIHSAAYMVLNLPVPGLFAVGLSLVVSLRLDSCQRRAMFWILTCQLNL